MYRLIEWYFTQPALKRGWASRLHTDEELQLFTVISFFFSPFSGKIVEAEMD